MIEKIKVKVGKDRHVCNGPEAIFSARSVLHLGWTEFSGCMTSPARALAAPAWVT